MNLCLYTPEQEEYHFIQKRAQTWQRSGLLSEDQLHMIEERTKTQLIQPSLFFRILSFVFTWICLAATVGFIIWLLDIDDERPIGFIFLVFSIPLYGLAEFAVKKYFLYRHGIEEALALMSLLLFCGGIVLIIFPAAWYRSNPGISTFAAVSCAFAYGLYLRFGFLYASLISMATLALFIHQFFFSPLIDRILYFLCFGLLFLFSLRTESAALEDFRKKRKELNQACLLGGIYLSVNVRIFDVAESWIDQTRPYLTPWAGLPPEAYWLSYVLTFLVPVVGLYLGIQKRKRALINVAGIALALSLATNKDYLGLKHYAWDPIILGATLILAAGFIIRWLAAGRNKERYGFTAESILKPERYGLGLPEIGAALMPGVTTGGETTAAESSPFEGGESGGGGASRSF